MFLFVFILTLGLGLVLFGKLSCSLRNFFFFWDQKLNCAGSRILVYKFEFKINSRYALFFLFLPGSVRGEVIS